MASSDEPGAYDLNAFTPIPLESLDAGALAKLTGMAKIILEEMGEDDGDDLEIEVISTAPNGEFKKMTLQQTVEGELAPKPTAGAPVETKTGAQSHVYALPLLDKTLTLRYIEDSGCGALIWDAAVAMIQYFTTDPSIPKNFFTNKRWV